MTNLDILNIFHIDTDYFNAPTFISFWKYNEFDFASAIAKMLRSTKIKSAGIFIEGCISTVQKENSCEKK